MSRRSQVARSDGTTVYALPRTAEEEIVFSLSGLVTPATSPPWVRPSDGVLVEVVALLGFAGTTPTSVGITKNGPVVHTITVAAGQVRQVDSGLNIFYGDTSDILTDMVTLVGAGAVDLTVIHRFRV